MARTFSNGTITSRAVTVRKSTTPWIIFRSTGVSEAFAGGVDSLKPGARQGIWAGLALGVALALAEKLAPKRLRAWIPSPAGLGIAMVIPGANALAMFLGSLVAFLLARWRPRTAERYVTPVASGFIAGESLMGVLISLLIVAGVLSR